MRTKIIVFAIVVLSSFTANSYSRSLLQTAKERSQKIARQSQRLNSSIQNGEFIDSSSEIISSLNTDIQSHTQYVQNMRTIMSPRAMEVSRDLSEIAWFCKSDVVSNLRETINDINDAPITLLKNNLYKCDIASQDAVVALLAYSIRNGHFLDAAIQLVKSFTPFEWGIMLGESLAIWVTAKAMFTYAQKFLPARWQGAARHEPEAREPNVEQKKPKKKQHKHREKKPRDPLLNEVLGSLPKAPMVFGESVFAAVEVPVDPRSKEQQRTISRLREIKRAIKTAVAARGGQDYERRHAYIQAMNEAHAFIALVRDEKISLYEDDLREFKKFIGYYNNVEFH